MNARELLNRSDVYGPEDEGDKRLMRDALLAVLDLHARRPYPWFPDRPDVCDYCSGLNWSTEGLDDDPDEYTWPCTTVKAINEALGVSDE